jgi:peptidoglycan/LPS O-acetylase OafA/YrhL
VLRGIAILAVVYYHAFGALFGFDPPPFAAGGGFVDFSVYGQRLPVLLYPLASGGAGVMMFFVVSGFCIHLGTLESVRLSGGDVRWSRFFPEFAVRRFLRLYPAYLIALLIFAFGLHITRVDLGNRAGRENLISHLLLVHNFLPAAKMGINGSFWSIATEVQLYAVYPLLLPLLMARISPALKTCALVAFAGCYETFLRNRSPTVLMEAPFAFWLTWGLGAVLASAWVEKSPLFGKGIPAWLIALFACLFAGIYLNVHVARWYWLICPLFLGLCVARYLRRDFRDIPLTLPERALIPVGAASYSIYLLHLPPLMLFHNAAHSVLGSSRLMVVVMLTLVPGLLILLSLPFYWWVETPLHRLARAAGNRVRDKLMRPGAAGLNPDRPPAGPAIE